MFAETQAELAELRKEHERAANRGPSQAGLEDALAEVSTLRAANETARAELAEAQTKLTGFKAKKAEFVALHIELEEALADVCRLDEDGAEKDSELADAKAELRTLREKHEATCAEAQAELAHALGEVARLCEEEVAQSVQSQTELAVVRTELARLQHEQQAQPLTAQKVGFQISNFKFQGTFF